MKISKRELRTIIKEEMEAAQAAAPAPKQKSDVAAVSKKLEKTSGLDKLLGRISNRAEFEQILGALIDAASANVDGNDVILGIKNVLAAKRKGKG